MTSDIDYMQRALMLAEYGLYTAHPNPRVGCVIVKDDQVIGEGWHLRTGDAHAEVNAIHQAGLRARGATCYVTMEPCHHHGRTPPCTHQLLEVGIRRLVVAMRDPNPLVNGKGVQFLVDQGMDVSVGLLENETRALNRGFISRMMRTRPYVRAKVAMSLDGRTAMASGEAKWITGAGARHDGQHWRAQSGALLTGSKTVLADDPAFTVRGYPVVEQPLKVVLDSRLRIDSSARILQSQGKVLLFHSKKAKTENNQFYKPSVELLHCPSTKNDKVDLAAVLQILAQREINEVLIEAGPVLSGAFLQAGLIDELIIYVAPKILGHAASAMFTLPGLDELSEHVPVTITDVRAIGDDWRIMAKPAR